MSGRSLPWVNKPDEETRAIVDDVLESTMYMVNEIGPTCFVVKEEDSEVKYKVTVGDVHECTCKTRRGKLCRHILFVVLKILRVPKESPLSWQVSLLDREVDEVLRMRHVRQRVQPAAVQKKEKKGDKKEEVEVERKQVEEEDVCPICQEEMGGGEEALTYCRRGCGNNIHVKCMRVWAEHKLSTEGKVTCPLCREDWGSNPLTELKKDAEQHRRPVDVHYGCSCARCRLSPIRGKRFKCLICADYSLCQSCFDAKVHSHHPFVCKDTTLAEEDWKEAVPPNQPTGVAESLLNELQGRELTSEDYDTLLQLDQPQSRPLYDFLISHLPTSSNADAMLAAREGGVRQPIELHSCCSCSHRIGDQPTRTLPCGHFMHEACLVSRFMERNYMCPRDSKPIFGGLSGGAAGHRKKKKKKKENDDGEERNEQNSDTPG
uniref:Uncharacterized protein n=1 Tax=Palpitomonas bilix TaxID=652834 RepID=A0A7S3DDN7_9EUKA